MTEVIEAELQSVFCRALGRPDFKANEGFLDSGGDSLTVIETQYGVTLSAAEFMALDTAENLARHIASAMQEVGSDTNTQRTSPADTRTMLSVVQDGGLEHPLICAYGMDGEAAYAVTAAKFFPDDQPIAALRVRANTVSSDEVRSFRDLAKGDAEQILQQYPHQSYVVLGYSLGAHIALAIGHELAQRGSPPALIAILDDEADLDRRHFGATQRHDDTTSTKGILTAALKRSCAEPIATRIVYFRAAENDAYYRSDPTCGWGEIATGGVTVYDLPFNHQEFVREHCLSQIAPLLQKEINAPVVECPKPNQAQIIRHQARLAARGGDLAKEISLLQQAIGDEADQPSWVYANLAEALFQRGDTADALAALSQARRREPWQLSLDLRFVSELQNPELKSERADVLRRLGALKADHPSVHEQKARIYFGLGRHKKCEGELRAGLAIHPLHLDLSRRLIQHLSRTKAWPELVTTVERLLQHFPDSGPFRNVLMNAYIERGVPQRALQFRDAIMARAEPRYKELCALGRAVHLCGDATDALEIAELAAKQEPSRPIAHTLRAQCLKSMGRLDDAAAARRMATNLRSSDHGTSQSTNRISGSKGFLARISRRLRHTLLTR